MAEHLKLGKQGEALAAEWLQKNGYEILHRNWKYSYFEIDIIALKDKILHFIEVKARHASSFGYPEEAVGKKKFKRLQRAADQFLYLNPGYKWIRYDILAITLFGNKEPEYFLLEDVFL